MSNFVVILLYIDQASYQNDLNVRSTQKSTTNLEMLNNEFLSVKLERYK